MRGTHNNTKKKELWKKAVIPRNLWPNKENYLHTEHLLCCRYCYVAVQKINVYELHGAGRITPKTTRGFQWIIFPAELHLDSRRVGCPKAMACYLQTAMRWQILQQRIV